MASPTCIRLLVTGFGPFPGVHDNPSGRLIQNLDRGKLRLAPDIELTTQTIPTSWPSVEKVFGQGYDLKADIALHFGVSARARGFQIEQVARNTASNRADCDGDTFDRPCLVRGEPARLRTPWNATRLARDLKSQGLPATVSNDAGAYLCNMLLYLSLLAARKQGSGRLTGFIHIPPLRPNSFDMSVLLRGAETIIKHCAHQWRHAALVGKCHEEY